MPVENEKRRTWKYFKRIFTYKCMHENKKCMLARFIARDARMYTYHVQKPR